MTGDFRIVGTATVTDAKLTSNVPETETAWSSVTAYVIGDERAHSHYLWKATKAGTNKEPGTTDGADYWTKIRPTNRWAMFDPQIDTQTVNADEIVVEIAEPRRFDTVALFKVQAAFVNVTVLDGETELRNVDYDMVDYSGIVGYWSLYFEEHDRKETLLVQGLPILSGLTLRVTATLEGGDVKIGDLAYGRAEEIGATLINPTIGFLSFSKIAPDELGQREIVKRTSRKQGDFDVAVPNIKFDSVYKTILAYDGVPALIIGSSVYESMIYRGLITGAKLTVPYQENPVLRISIEDF